MPLQTHRAVSRAMSIFTGLKDTSPVAVLKEPEEHTEQKIFPDNWTSAPTRTDSPLQQVQVERKPVAGFHEESVLQRIEAVLSNILDDISSGISPSIRAHDESTKAGTKQLQLSLESSADSQRFCRAMAVLERVQVCSSALADSYR